MMIPSHSDGLGCFKQHFMLKYLQQRSKHWTPVIKMATKQMMHMAFSYRHPFHVLSALVTGLIPHFIKRVARDQDFISLFVDASVTKGDYLRLL